jgi:sialidase-1
MDGGNRGRIVFLFFLVAVSAAGWVMGQSEMSYAELKKVEDIVIYSDPKFYAAFPSVICRPDGELIVAFRRAPERRLLGEKDVAHADSNSQLVLVRPADNGRTWSEPELIFAHPLGGSQDPCLLQLRDGTIVCTSYGWCRVPPDFAKDDPAISRYRDFAFMGGYILKSFDGGRTWLGPIIPPPVPGSQAKELCGAPCPAFNRGAMCEGSDGRLYWGVTKRAGIDPQVTSIQLFVSRDQGETWEHRCGIAGDPTGRVQMNETSLYMTPGGKLVAFIRTFGNDDYGAVAFSTDGGKSFGLWLDAGFKGHPHHLLRLPDNRALLVYGYRREPYGIRARVLEPECGDFASAAEIVIRDDGGNADIGYPWAVVTADGRILIVYYFNLNDGTRHIAGTILAPEGK